MAADRRVQRPFPGAHAILAAAAAGTPALLPCTRMPRRPPDEPTRIDDAPARRTVFVAPARATRPTAGTPAECPFCAGHEHLTPLEILRSPADPRLPWRARIVPNRYPFVVEGAAAGVGPSRPARGVHDVIVESPRHHRSVLEVEPAAWEASWDLARRRLAELAARRDLAWATLYKNSGPGAGASLEHVHSQLVALDVVPDAVRPAARGGDSAAERVAAARREGRVVALRDGLVALVPPAPRQPFETWIVPRAAPAWFHEADPGLVRDLARLLRVVVAALERVAPGADYNWWLLQPPWRRRTAGGWWRIEILPRVTPLAGFELGTGCHVCVVPPREAARRLRLALPSARSS
jgi:UDPglucose--hexose-1-phosphate uridylyltransferase